MSPNALNNSSEELQTNQEQTKTRPKQDIVWANVGVLAVMHLLSLHSFWSILTMNIRWLTLLFNLIYGMLTLFGTFAGSHRLWSHRSFKAKKPLRYFLALAQAAAFQKDIFQWVREHRVHHKHVDTDADPHNSTRGFVFSHMGWLLLKKLPDVTEKGKTIDLSDVVSDPVVQFQRKYYFQIAFLLTFLVPTILPMYFWGETFSIAFSANALRFIWTSHATGAINSFAHMIGSKPYNKNIKPVENVFVSMVSGGEGFHNYHHTFPWDYKAAELGKYSLNFTTAFLDLMALIGQAYDLKTVPKEMVKNTILKKGDGSWINHSHQNNVWGWGDKDMKKEDKDITEVKQSFK